MLVGTTMYKGLKLLVYEVLSYCIFMMRSWLSPRRHHYVQGPARANGKGNNGFGTAYHEGQDRSARRAPVLRLCRYVKEALSY